VLELPRPITAMSDINDDAKHIGTFQEFIVHEADYARLRQNETDKQLMAIALHLGNNLQE
jgi:hypothetical protein